MVEDVLADKKQAVPAQLLQLLADPQKANAALGDGKAIDETGKEMLRQRFIGPA